MRLRVRFVRARSQPTIPARTCRTRDGTLPGVDGVDDNREVQLTDDLPVLPDQTSDDTDRGWGERSWTNDDRLLEDRPPHWG